jgi:hypothetical protein
MGMDNSTTEKAHDQELSILVNSCDKYADLWPIFFALFWKYWPDCPFPVYLGANENMFKHSRVEMITVGSDRSWAETTRRMLELIPSPYVLFFLDDFFIYKPVDTAVVKSLAVEMKELNADYLRFRPAPPPDVSVSGHPRVGRIRPGAEYRCSLGIALWRRETFLKLLRDGETAWQMEILGSRRSEAYGGFYSTWDTIIERTNGLEAGKWLRYNLPLLKREGLVVPPGHPVMSRSEHAARWMRKKVLNPLLDMAYAMGKPVKQTILRHHVK